VVRSLQACSVTLYVSEDFTVEIKCWFRTHCNVCCEGLFEEASNHLGGGGDSFPSGPGSPNSRGF
jgi:hypothetical protein